MGRSLHVLAQNRLQAGLLVRKERELSDEPIFDALA